MVLLVYYPSVMDFFCCLVYIYVTFFFWLHMFFLFKFTIIVINNKLVIGHDILKIYTSTKPTEPYM